MRACRRDRRGDFDGSDFLWRLHFGCWIWSAHRRRMMSVAGLRSELRATGFERLEVSNTILMGVTRVWTRKKARSDPILIMRIARARCWSAAAAIAAKTKFWPAFFYPFV